jgi:hypothetical protein
MYVRCVKNCISIDGGTFDDYTHNFDPATIIVPTPGTLTLSKVQEIRLALHDQYAWSGAGYPTVYNLDNVITSPVCLPGQICYDPVIDATNHVIDYHLIYTLDDSFCGINAGTYTADSSHIGLPTTPTAPTPPITN